jgi:hypothetical protein
MKKYFIGLAIILIAGWFIYGTVDKILYREEEKIEFIEFREPNLFTERIDQCQNSNATTFDLKIDPKPWILCSISLSKYCQRHSPVEEQKYFYVIAPIYSLNQNNNALLSSLHTSFKYYCESLGVHFVQVEYTIGNQDYLMTKPGLEPHDIQLKGNHMFYLRENLVNVAEKKLPEDYEYISWIDAHVFFDDPYIFQKSIVALGKNNIVSPLSRAYFKSKTNRTEFNIEYSYSYVAYYHNSTPLYQRASLLNKNKWIFPYYGLAYVTRKDIFRDIGGLPDLCIAGSCDLLLGHATTNYFEDYDSKNPYNRWWNEWLANAGKVFDRKMTYLPAHLYHFDHYWQLRRQSSWGSSGSLLKLRNFDPFKHMNRDSNGTLYFVDNFELSFDFWKLYSSI